MTISIDRSVRRAGLVRADGLHPPILRSLIHS